MEYCNVTGLDQGHYVDTQCTLIWGEGNIDVEPMFADAANRDYHLKVPRAAGTAASAIGFWMTAGIMTRPMMKTVPVSMPATLRLEPATNYGANGGSPNIGAYGGTEQASRSASQKCCMMCLPADFNCDCLINLEDLTIMLEDWLNCNLLPRYYCDQGAI